MTGVKAISPPTTCPLPLTPVTINGQLFLRIATEKCADERPVYHGSPILRWRGGRGERQDAIRDKSRSSSSA